MRLLAFALCIVVSAACPPASAQQFATHEADFMMHGFTFKSGESLPDVRMHYTTLGAPVRDKDGHVTNAVLILHGTGGDGHQFLRPQFAGVLFTADGILDPARYFIILPDDVGFGKSSKPSDGLHARFPHYAYADLVEAEYRLVTEGLGVDRLRLIMGTSMGCMHAFMWGEAHPDFVQALMPLACLPIQIAGRNRLWREMIIGAIQSDPAWKGGEYGTDEPRAALRMTADILTIVSSAPIQMQKSMPTRDAADAWLRDHLKEQISSLDANDVMYQVAASRDYDPSAALDKIKAHVMWVNTADDFINPPELGIAEREAKKLARGKFVLIPASDQTHGHGTHTWAAVWQDYLKELLKESERPGDR